MRLALAGRRRAGMTLMELVVAITITGLMATAGATAFSSIIEHRRVIQEANMEVERGSALRDMVRTWVTSGSVMIQSGVRGANARGSAVTVRANPNAPAGVTAAVAAGDELVLSTTALTPAMSPSTRIRLFIDGDDATPEYGLTMEFQPSTNAPLQRRQIDPTIGLLIVEFLDNRTKQWFAASQGATITPIAVRITFGSADSASYRLPAVLEVPMVFAIPNARITTAGAR